MTQSVRVSNSNTICGYCLHPKNQHTGVPIVWRCSSKDCDCIDFEDDEFIKKFRSV